jgi:thioredoxin reductase
MDTWRNHMPAEMLLKSDGFATNMSAPIPGWTLGDYCRRQGLPYNDLGDWPRTTLAQFVQYGLAFQHEFAPSLDQRQVADLGRTRGGFTLGFDDGEVITARRVVLAVGITHFAFTPPELRGLGDRVTTTSAHTTFERFAGRRVATIGGGSSAVEVSASLIEAGAHVHLLARGAEIPFWGAPDPDAPRRSLLDRVRRPSSGLGPGIRNRLCQELPDVFRHLPSNLRVWTAANHLGPMSPWWLKDAVLGHADVRTETTVRAARADDDTVVLTTAANGRDDELRVDHVICGTGYPPDIDRLRFLDPEIRGSLRRAGAMPELSRYFESSLPGMYFVGAAAAGSFGPLMRFVVGTEFAAPRLATHLKRRARDWSRQTTRSLATA